jgi:hypothetical protein
MKHDELRQMLVWLPINGRLDLPLDILEKLFPHAPNTTEMDTRSFQAAQALAEEHGCIFGYDDEANLGIFQKLDAGSSARERPE